jgi:hypothetical protein
MLAATSNRFRFFDFVSEQTVEVNMCPCLASRGRGSDINPKTGPILPGGDMVCYQISESANSTLATSNGSESNQRTEYFSGEKTKMVR